MFTPWNSFSACLLAKSDRISGDRLDLLNRGHVIPLGFTPPVEDAAERCPACPVGSGNPTGVESFPFLSRSMRHACYSSGTPCSMRSALCAMPSAVCHQSSAICSLRHAPCLLLHWGSVILWAVIP